MRIVTRPDFDGVVCAVLLVDLFGDKTPVVWVEPSDLLSGRIIIRPGDVIANLPYRENCQLWFDHHYTNRIDTPFRGVYDLTPSAARLIFRHYFGQFHRDFSDLVAAADKIDSADLTMEEVLNPENHPYILLSMTISNGETADVKYWNRIVDRLRQAEIQAVIADAEISRRCRAVLRENEHYTRCLQEHTRLVDNVSITDFRSLDRVPAGNRFLVYSLFPDSVVNLRLQYEDETRKTVVAHAGHSIFNPNCRVNLGLMLTEFGGGGHRGAAAGRFPSAEANQYIAKIIETLVKNEDNENPR